MKPYTILVPLDGSPFSRQIMLHVCRMFNPHSYGIVLLRVADMPDAIGGLPPRPLAVGLDFLSTYDSVDELSRASHPIYRDQVAESYRAELLAELLVDSANLQDLGYDVATAVRFGDPAAEIIDFARSEPVDLIAMATHGHTGFRQLVLGSVAREVLLHSPIPVMLVQPLGSQPDLDALSAQPDTLAVN